MPATTIQRRARSTRTLAADKERLTRLAEFGPTFRDPKCRFGKWHRATGTGSSKTPFTLPWFEHGKVATDFCDMLSNSGWILRNFDWAKWSHSAERQKFFAKPDAIASADCQQLAKLLTAIVRQDRFVEGALAAAYKNKTLLAIVERAEALLGAGVVSARKRKERSSPARSRSSSGGSA